MPRRTDQREKPAFSPAEELRGGALAPLDSHSPPSPPEKAAPRRRRWPEEVAVPRWARAMILFGAGATLAVGATRLIVDRLFGAPPFAAQSFLADVVLILFGLFGLGLALGPFLAEKTPAEPELTRSYAMPVSWLSGMGIATILSMMMHMAWEQRSELPTRDPGVPIEELRRRADARPDHLQTQFALGAAEHDAGRFAQAEAPLARARDLAGGDGFVHPTDASLAQPEWKKRVQALYALNHAHLLLPKQALVYYSAAYTLGDRSSEVYRGLAEGWMTRADYREAARVAQEYIATVESDPELVKLRDAALRIEWDREQSTIDAVSSRTIGWPNQSSPPSVAAARAAIEAKLTPRQRESWREARLGYASLKDAITTYSEKMDWKSGRMLADVDAKSTLTEAARHTLRAIELAPEMAHYRLQLGMIYTIGGDYPTAVSAFDAAVRRDPRVREEFPSYMHVRRFAADRAAGRNQVQLWSFTLVAPPPPGTRPRVP